MSPKKRGSRSCEASKPAMERGEANAARDATNIEEEEAKAGVAALLTPDAEALAAVCDSDNDDEDQDLDTGDVTIREGEEKEIGGVKERKRRAVLASSRSALCLN